MILRSLCSQMIGVMLANTYFRCLFRTTRNDPVLCWGYSKGADHEWFFSSADCTVAMHSAFGNLINCTFKEPSLAI